MDIKFWIWLIIIVGSMILQARKKKKAAAPEGRKAAPEPTFQEEETSKPMSFEDLLREIEVARNPVPKAKPAPLPTFDVLDYDDNLEEEAKSLEKTDYRYPQPSYQNEAYEQARQQAFNRPSLEETLKLQDTVVRFGQFKGYQHEEKINVAAELAKEIRNPSGFKKAFIMSEILKRRF